MRRPVLAFLAAAAVGRAQQPAAHEMPQEMVWVDRTGRILGRVGSPQMSIFFPELSPDGRSIAVSARDGETNDRDVWVHDVGSGAKRVMYPAKGNDNFPVWSPDGKELIFTSSRGGGYDMRRGDAVLLKAPVSEYPRSWSPDGRWLIYTSADTKRDLFLLPLDGPAEPKPLVVDAKAWSDGARFSPDGRYFAFVSNAAGPFEVYVASTADPSRRWKVSRELANGWAGGGGQVRWRRDGKELFYMMGNDTMLSVEVSTAGEFRFSAPKRLFALRGMMGNFPEEAPYLAKYDVTADGQRFVFVRTIPK